MTIRTKCRWDNVTCSMTKETASESTGGMTSTTILGGRHVLVEWGGKRHTARRTRAIGNMTGDATITHDASMIDERANESIGVMAITTVRVCCYV